MSIIKATSSDDLRSKCERTVPRPPGEQVPIESQLHFERLIQFGSKSPNQDSNDTTPSCMQQFECHETLVSVDRVNALEPDDDSDSPNQPGTEATEKTLDETESCEPYGRAFRDIADGELASENLSQFLSTQALPSPIEHFSPAILRPIAAVPSDVVTVSNDSRLLDLARQVADRILISDTINGPQSIHIQIKDSILPGAEVRLSQLAGQLQVQFLTDQQTSLDFLLQQQGSLGALLEQRLVRPVTVQVELDSSGHFNSQDSSSDNPPRRESEQDDHSESSEP